MQIDFRSAQIQDFDYCRTNYISQKGRVTPEQEASFLDQWNVSEVQIIMCDGVDAGWLQSRPGDDAVYLVRFVLEEGFHERGIVREVMAKLVQDARLAGRPTPNIVKSCDGKRLYISVQNKSRKGA